MEKYLLIVLLTAPGYIAKMVARWLGDNQSKKGEFDAIMSYFCYSLFSLLITVAICLGLRFISLSDTWQDLERNISSLQCFIKIMVLAITVSVIIGALWQLKIKSWISQLLFYINKRYDRYIFLSGSLFHQKFDDCKDHFVILERDGKMIAAGFITGWTSSNAEKLEISIAAYPEYAKWLEYIRNGKMPKHPLNTVKQVYYDGASGTVITELDFPQEWLAAHADLPPED